ncbi:MAG: tRNA pseudouridine(13) synthase TruD [Thermoprotei archaeon]|nr:MAG: tRNA pseudouridine(13) synthase TruD [Thermoprotei archaeon]
MRLSQALLDKLLGLEVYISSTDGIGGTIKSSHEDFIVEEISEEGMLCSISSELDVVEGSGNYTWFVLVKRGLDTLAAIRKIARYFKISSKRFSAAGLKDARALTAQLVCVEGVSPEELLSFNDESGKVKILVAFKRPYKLMPGMLYGNSFKITIRNICLAACEIEKRIYRILNEIVEAGGVPAYYGYQRFGTIRPITHIVGRYVVRKEFEKAILTLLTEIFPHESERAKEARKYLKDTMDFKGALELFPKTLHHERAILYYLIKHPNDFFGAFRALPLTIRRLFIGAFQAYLFNRVLSERIKSELPISKAVAGDIVAVLSRRGYSVRVKGVFRANASNVEKLNEFIKRGVAVLALNVFGYDTVLCDGMPGEIERKVLRREGVSIKDFRIKHMPEISSRGTLRIAAFHPENFKISEIGSDEFFKNKSKVSLEFVLKKGLYATVFLREIMKPSDVYKAGL